MKCWYVYILKCADSTFYTGITTDPKRRLREHNYTAKASRYTRSRRPSELVFVTGSATRSSASKLEVEIKKMNRENKKSLIESSCNLCQGLI